MSEQEEVDSCLCSKTLQLFEVVQSYSKLFKVVQSCSKLLSLLQDSAVVLREEVGRQHETKPTQISNHIRGMAVCLNLNLGLF